ncbi:MAG: uroporphyrinogen-III synthase [Flavisolibacter sp.]
MTGSKVLSTKKLDPLLIEKAKQHHIAILEREFIAVRPLPEKALAQRLSELTAEGQRTLAVTSSHAISVLPALPGVVWKVFCLSGKTREAVLKAGVSESAIAAVARDAGSLALEILRQGEKEVIFICGDKRRDELPDRLRDAGVRVSEITVYETVETPQVVDRDWDAVLFFSPSAVQSFFAANRLSEKTVCFAIGPTTAGCLAGFTENPVLVSEEASQEKMVEALIHYFGQANARTKNQKQP